MKITALLVITLFFSLTLYNCSKSDPDPAPTVVTPDPDPAPAVLGRALIDSLSPLPAKPFNQFTNPKIIFHQAINKTITLNDTKKDVRYRPVLDELSIEGITTRQVWSSDSLSVTLTHEEAFNPNAQIKVKAVAHWEQFKDSKWSIINWDKVDLKEVKESTYNSGAGITVIQPAYIEYQYPIPNQYHFLPKESANGFIKLKVGSSYLFSDSNVSTWVEFTGNGASDKMPVTYNAEKKLISYSIPPNLLNEKIYTVVLKQQNKTTSAITELLKYSIRTSKFNTFTDKVAGFTLAPNALQGLYIPWRIDFLAQDFTASEYLDEFEMESKTEKLDATISGQYSSNLISFHAIMSGNTYFDNTITPWLYSPWTDAGFKPVLTRDTSTVGFKPVRAMYTSSNGGRLKEDQITSNSAPALTSASVNRIYYLLVPYLAYDFTTLQTQVVKKYPSLDVPEREKPLVLNQTPMIAAGIYKYKIRYRLPDGTITSSVELSMNNR